MSSQQQQQQQLPNAFGFLNQQQQLEEVQRPGKNHVTNVTASLHETHTSHGRRWYNAPQLMDNLIIIFGEMTATAMLMVLGCMGCVTSESFANSFFQSCLTFGFVVLICIQCFGFVCGAHLNPCVTVAALVYRTISLRMAIAYFVAQMLGAFIGYGLLKAVLPADAITGPQTPAGVCVTALHSDLSPIQGVFIEFIITCTLIAFCCGVWDPQNEKYGDSVPIRFALAIVGLSLIAGQFTGASMNPVRSFAPALWNNAWANHWIYWVGPLSAAAVTSMIYKYVFRRKMPKPIDPAQIE